jgi:hypothetical protein
MKLADLNPAFTRYDSGQGHLSFDCPCSRDCGRRIRQLPTFDGEPRQTSFHSWGLTGSPPDWDSVSLKPSINYDNEHWHGYITNGEIR